MEYPTEDQLRAFARRLDKIADGDPRRDIPPREITPEIRAKIAADCTDAAMGVAPLYVRLPEPVDLDGDGVVDADGRPVEEARAEALAELRERVAERIAAFLGDG